VAGVGPSGLRRNSDHRVAFFGFARLLPSVPTLSGKVRELARCLQFTYCMRLLRALLALATLALGAPGIAKADAPAIGPTPDRGTHFIVQATGGVTATETGTFGVVVGAGGRIGALRLYAIFEAAWASAETTGRGTTGGYSATLKGADLAGGLRALVVAQGGLRLYVDLLAGATRATYSLDRAGLESLSSRTWPGLIAVAGGLDVRLLRSLSVGARIKGYPVDQEPGWLAATHVGLTRSVDITAGFTFHF
jgi:hypothetical protein